VWKKELRENGKKLIQKGVNYKEVTNIKFISDKFKGRLWKNK